MEEGRMEEMEENEKKKPRWFEVRLIGSHVNHVLCGYGSGLTRWARRHSAAHPDYFIIIAPVFEDFELLTAKEARRHLRSLRDGDRVVFVDKQTQARLDEIAEGLLIPADPTRKSGRELERERHAAAHRATARINGWPLE